MKRKLKNSLLLTAGIVFMSSAALPVLNLPIQHAQAASSTAVASPYKNISIGNQLSVKLVDSNLIPNENGNVASFTISFNNDGARDVQFIDYWARLRSNSGSQYTLTLLDADKKKSKIASKSSQTYTFYAQVGSKETLSNLNLQIIKFDFSTAGYERSLAKFTFPQGFTGTVKSGGFKAIPINNSFVNTRPDSLSLNKTLTGYKAKVKFLLRNASKVTIPLPTYDYYIQSSEGNMYKLTPTTKLDNFMLEPGVLKEVALSADLPALSNTTAFRLVVTQNVASKDGDKINIPVGSYVIPNKQVVENTTTNTKASYSNDFGTYDAELTNLQRLPWLSSDNVVAQVVIRNKGNSYLPLPAYLGKFILDNNVNVDAKEVQNTADVGLAPGAQTIVYLYGTIPYNYALNDINITLNQKDETEEVQLLSFNQKGTAFKLPTIPVGSAYESKDNGREVAVSIDSIRTYTGASSDYVAAYVNVTNAQQRNAELNAWTGYFKTSDGVFRPAKLLKGKGNVTPGHKEQIVLYADLPKNTNTKDMQLIIGEGVNEKGYATTEEGLLGYVNAVAFQVPGEVSASNQFQNLKVGPYTLNFSSLVTHLDVNEVKFGINVDIARDNTVDVFSPRKITMKIEDIGTGKAIISEDVEIENPQATRSWKQGFNTDLITKDLGSTMVGTNYMLSIYETIDGKTKLLASKSITWNPFTNWADPNAVNS
ncbi:hypothetical protein [Cohnella nanjingensis]|uniref:Uncharacterized protein n=1 Tax=Cohnella nanjingensis TaxID=1387779 RepID=A0A7X0VFH3_9BACL|nr:hypothetical protein [Cohnella nanjingensis]MBB6670614.1 hypothetical protein [Cohnella nanjingensis]